MQIQDMNNNSPGWKPKQADIVSLLNTMPLGVISTSDGTGQPQAATVAFSQTKNLELIIGTSETSRKSLNMLADPRVAFTVTDPEKRYTVQFEGLAKKLSKSEFDHFTEGHFKKLPASAPFRDILGQCYFILNPNWVRFTDCSTYPWTSTELVFHF